MNIDAGLKQGPTIMPDHLYLTALHRAPSIWAGRVISDGKPTTEFDFLPCMVVPAWIGGACKLRSMGMVSSYTTRISYSLQPN